MNFDVRGTAILVMRRRLVGRVGRIGLGGL
jgi:hypothetical protein